MQITGMCWGEKLLKYVNFPCAEVLGADSSSDELRAMIDRCGSLFVKPVFKGGVGKKGKSGLIGHVNNVQDALKEKERLYFAKHTQGNQTFNSNGVTFEGSVPAKYEIYVSITDSTKFRAPTLTLSHHGGVDIETQGSDKVASAPFDPLTGLNGFVISNLLTKLNAPNELISPLVQNLPKLWDLFHNYGMSMVEINPIRMMPDKKGRLVPVACDFKCSFDQDDPSWKRLKLPADLFTTELSDFEREVNELRTYQGQSDVFVTNNKGSVTAMTFGGGASSLVTELLGNVGTISSDFGGNPPYEKMRKISSIVYRYWLEQSNVLFIIGGKANNTDIYETFRAMGDALRDYFNTHGPKPIFVIVGRGGPNLVRGLGTLGETLDNLKVPYRMFGYDSSISTVVDYAKAIDNWMENKGGKESIAKAMGLQSESIEPSNSRKRVA